jgi:ubiquinone/menaquinone biosynthesis C-methylase UbiE
MNPDQSVRYDRSQQEWDEVLSDPERQRVGQSWLRDDTLDAWRHARIRAPLKTFVDQDPAGTWLTIGDGRYGTDAHYLLGLGAKSVHCTDISDTLLKIGHNHGFIQAYSAENAEALGFADHAFDYVYCKESFHHFPRPWRALDEMFRVARKAVILTEPRDRVVDRARWSLLPRLLKRLLGKDRQQHYFEPVGNYIYSLSEREIEKFMLGMHHTHVAFLASNDAYVPGVEFSALASSSPADRRLRSKVQGRIKRLDALTRLGLVESTLLTAALFKAAPAPALANALARDGWALKQLPQNPYLK